VAIKFLCRRRMKAPLCDLNFGRLFKLWSSGSAGKKTTTPKQFKLGHIKDQVTKQISTYADFKKGTHWGVKILGLLIDSHVILHNLHFPFSLWIHPMLVMFLITFDGASQNLCSPFTIQKKCIMYMKPSKQWDNLSLMIADSWCRTLSMENTSILDI